MAVVKWSIDDEEKKRREDPFSLPSINPVRSVQSSWQPTQATNDSTTGGGDQEDNYLLSEEKAQVDESIRQQRQAEEAARAEAEARARAEMAWQSSQPTTTVTQQTSGNRPRQGSTKARPKYTPAKEGGLKGFLKGVGAGIQQGLGAVGDVAIQGGAVVGSIGKSGNDLVQHMDRANQARAWLHNRRDITGRRTIGTTDVDHSASRIAQGQGSVRDFVSVGAKGLQVGVDSTMFMSPARMLTKGVPTIGQAASTAGRSLPSRVFSSPAVRYAGRDAGFFGGLQGVATTGQQYGETGDIVESLKAGGQDALIGGVLQGSLDLGGHVTRRGYETFLPMANKSVNSLRRPRDVNIGNEVVDLEPISSEPVQPTAQNELPEISTEATRPEQRQTPVQEDGNVSFERDQNTIPNDIMLPINDAPLPRITQDYTPPTNTGLPPSQLDSVADGIALPENSPLEGAPNSPDMPQRDLGIEGAPSTPDPSAPLTPAPVADGTVQPPVIPARDPNVPTIRSDEVRELQDARAGSSQAEEAEINQRLQEVEQSTPQSTGNLPDELEIPMPTKADGATTSKPVDPEKQARKDFANVFTRSTDSNSDMDTRLRNATGMTKEAGSEVAQILEDGGVTGKQSERITKLFDRAAEIAENNKATQKQYRKDFIKGGREAIDDAPARQRNRETEEAAYVRSQLNSELKKLERKGDWGEKLTQGFENVISGKNSNQLIGAPIERGLTAEVIGNAMNTIKAPIRQIRGATMHGMPGKSAVKRLVRELKTPPKTVTEGYKYLIGNTYRAAMTPAQALADSRKGAFRTELTKYAYKGKIGKELSNKDAERVSRMAGNDMEALVNMGAGVDNGTISILAYRKALKQWKKFIESGSEADYGKFMDTIDRQTSIVDKLAQGFSTQGKNRAQRAGLTLVNALLPYMRNAVNMSTRGVVLDLNPFTLSLLDGIRTDQRGFMSNLALGIKNKTVDYAVLAALGSVLTYNDGTDPDTVDQPRGVSIHLGGDEYFAIRGTPLELPLGALMVAKQLAQDGVEGNFKDVGYYGGMITPSIPYADYMTSHGNVIDSIEKWGTEEGDNGYAAKNFLVGNAKSLTPFSNNNIEASLSRFGDEESLTAKTVYASKDVPDGEGGTKKVADMPQWYKNSLANNNLGKVLPFVPDRSELKDSRDAAGRIRTVDNQGSWMRKKINDADTATYNKTVADLVKFARGEGLGKGTQEMFNTYPDGSENNFKSAQDAITFLDVKEDAKGKKTPDPADKLKQNAKLADLNSQVYNGFFGDTGNDLLTLDGQELKSDASIPNSDGTKNSKLPLNMQSIKNAVAATDLPEAERNRMYEISQQNQALYSKVESKEWTYDQYKQVKAESEQEYVSILSNSKNFKKMTNLMSKLDETGFFEAGGLGSTKSGQTYLWNSLNALLGNKGATPAANYPKDDKGWTPWGKRGGGGGGSGSRAVLKPGEQGTHGIKWTPAGKRQMASVQKGTYTPYKAKVTLGSAVKKDKSQNYSDRTF